MNARLSRASPGLSKYGRCAIGKASSRGYQPDGHRWDARGGRERRVLAFDNCKNYG